MNRSISIVQYWGGCPRLPNSKWRRVLRTIQQCARRGWQTSLVWSAMPPDTALSKPFADIGCDIVLQPRSQKNFEPACVWRACRLLRRLRCDLLHCHNVHTSPLLGAALAHVPVRLWSKLSMSPYYEAGTTPTGLHRLQLSTRVSAALSHRILCISKAVHDELAGMGIPEHKLVRAPVPVDLNVYHQSPNGSLRTEPGLNESSFIITAVGYTIWTKGWDILIAAFTKVAAAVPQAELVLVGATRDLHGKQEARWSQLRSMMQQLCSMARQAGLEDRVHFLGERADVPAILSASDIFVMPSRSEGLGSALLEALAAGLPCVAARVGGIPDVISSGENGLLFEREDAAGLADALIRLIRDTRFRERLARAARVTAKQYDLAADAEWLTELYATLLESCGCRLDSASVS